MNKELLNIQTIRIHLMKRNVVWTKHCLNKMNRRDILISDIKTAINNGKIIEYYYEDYPYPSCLILGKDNKNNTIHIVCGLSDNFIYMITAYYPDNEEWEEDMKTRRKE